MLDQNYLNWTFLALILTGCNIQPSNRLLEHGGIIRGDINQKKLSLVFTGDEFADGANHIENVLNRHDIKATFFFTGNFYRNEAFSATITSLKQNGHYLGAHSDRHLLYCAWENRDSLLVTEAELKKDIEDNYKEMERLGILRKDALYFMPPYEWYNDQISTWTSELGLKLVNYTPGTRSNADYTTPDMGDRYLSSDYIFKSILAYEQTDRNGLNGFLLLIHIGTAPERTDKFYTYLDALIVSLSYKGYHFVRVDELLVNPE